ncbi:MAG: hypothetical protein GKR89_33200 [Candidatus Latescibacteria bacterium]|nr:hypothetical protein [Candidatus Latescibacterota bacterium]
MKKRIVYSAILVGFMSATGYGQEVSRADFNEDGKVDFADFFLFVETFGAKEGAPAWDPIFDFTADGQINFADFFVFVEAFGGADLSGDVYVRTRADLTDLALGEDGNTTVVPICKT